MDNNLIAYVIPLTCVWLQTSLADLVSQKWLTVTATSSPLAGRPPGRTEALPLPATMWREKTQGQEDGPGSTALPSVYVYGTENCIMFYYVKH